MFISPNMSLNDLLGGSYIDNIYKIKKIIDVNDDTTAGYEQIDFYPIVKQQFHESFIDKIRCKITDKFDNNNHGAPTYSFRNAAHDESAGATGTGCYRIGEDGFVYLLGKSEHYHASLGHNFNGYKLLNKAREVGISNAAHNNTRGYITRKAECELIKVLNNIDDEKIDDIISSEDERILNRIINLSTGSLGVEAGIKMMLANFYQHDKSASSNTIDKTPVFLVIGDYNGGLTANYHGTTIIDQTLRGMWQELYKKISDNNIYKIVPVNINDVDDFKEKLAIYNTGIYKTAGFIHEIILMNYGAIRLDKQYLQEVYGLCKEYDTPIMVDEIQTCMWYKDMFLFKSYELHPDIVVIGKGFPGGEYAASKIITNAKMDNLTQFGALVTNGQEELASIAYLITMTFNKANSDIISELGNYFYNKLNDNLNRYNIVKEVQGLGHCVGIHFHDIETAKSFAALFNKQKIDYALHLYKAYCPPAILFKPPIISSKPILDYICDKIIDTLEEMM